MSLKVVQLGLGGKEVVVYIIFVGDSSLKQKNGRYLKILSHNAITTFAQKYKKKCGLERPATQKPPASNKTDKIPVEAPATTTTFDADTEATLPPVPPVAAAAVTVEPELLVEETDMDELD